MGDLQASGSVQGPLEEGDWVKGGEDVTVSGPLVVYEGTSDLYPPSGVCNVVLQDNDGTFSTASHVAGEAASLTLAVDDATDAEETLTMTLQDLPGLATVINQLQFALGVDGDAPAFTHAVPDPDDWHSSSQVLAGITADDGITAGVRAASLEYAYSIDGGTTWTDWTTNGLEVGADGLQVDGMVLLTIPDGDDNFIRWRVSDLVGNGPALSVDLRIKVDTINVTYTGAFPDPDAWHKALDVETGVTIRVEDGAGIEVASIQFRVSYSNLSGYGEWRSWGASVDNAQEISVGQVVTFGDSAFNYVQWRAKDIAGNGYTTSPHYRVRVDITPVAFSDLFPDAGPHGQATMLCGANVSDGLQGSGVLLSSIDYRVFTDGAWGEWTNVGMTGSSPRNQFSVQATFGDGTDNRIQFRGSDVAGNGPTLSEELVLTVDTTGPEFGLVSPDPMDKQPGNEVTVTVTITDATTNVQPGSAKVRYGTEGTGSMGDWEDVTIVSDGQGTWTATLAILFAPGVDNVVEFMATDVLGNEASSTVGNIWVNRAPLADIKSPTSEEVYSENEPVSLNGTLSSDPDDDDLNYTWYHDLQVGPIGYGRLLEADLPVGTYNVTLVVTDDMGAVDQTSVQVTVEEYIPPSTETSSVLWWVLLVVVLACVGAAVFFMWRRRETMEEWEEV